MRLYPEAWRRRYGDEFVELLIADLTELNDLLACDGIVHLPED